MYYSNLPEMVRVDFFREHGKWYATESVDMSGTYNDLTLDAVKASVKRQIGDRYKDMWAVCLQPYVIHSFPVMFRVV